MPEVSLNYSWILPWPPSSAQWILMQVVNDIGSDKTKRPCQANSKDMLLKQTRRRAGTAGEKLSSEQGVSVVENNQFSRDMVTISTVLTFNLSTISTTYYTLILSFEWSSKELSTGPLARNTWFPICESYLGPIYSASSLLLPKLTATRAVPF